MESSYLNPLVVNALLRVEGVPKLAPEPFESISTDAGYIWVYEILDDCLPIDQWADEKAKELDELVPILEEYPSTQRFLHIRTKWANDIPSHHLATFPVALLKRAQACNAVIEHLSADY